ncbi:MAG: hypothetical protein KGS61_15970 [Verrucomicrobia bacterium]|nr:hypothetical protein [Verrucomicrobiota bacterium]
MIALAQARMPIVENRKCGKIDRLILFGPPSGKARDPQRHFHPETRGLLRGSQLEVRRKAKDEREYFPNPTRLSPPSQQAQHARA